MQVHEFFNGLSPLARGTDILNGDRRFIPADVGNMIPP